GLEELRDVLLIGRIVTREAGRANPGRSVEPVDLEAGALADPPAARLGGLGEAGPRGRVVGKGKPRLLRHLDVAERLDLPVRDEGAELAQLALVPRCEDCVHSSQRTARTSSSCDKCSTT